MSDRPKHNCPLTTKLYVETCPACAALALVLAQRREARPVFKDAFAAAISGASDIKLVGKVLRVAAKTEAKRVTQRKKRARR
jgi:hypothetical protein